MTWRPPLWVRAATVAAIGVAGLLTQFDITVAPTRVVQAKLAPATGYLPEHVCFKIKPGQKLRPIVNAYGDPRDDGDNRLLWATYPLMEDHDRHCTIHFDGDYPNGRVSAVSLELA